MRFQRDFLGERRVRGKVDVVVPVVGGEYYAEAESREGEEQNCDAEHEALVPFSGGGARPGAHVGFLGGGGVVAEGGEGGSFFSFVSW